MFWKKKKRKLNPEVEAVRELVEKKKGYEPRVFVAINDENLAAIAEWCTSEGYKIEPSHKSDDVKYYKISGWD